MKKINVIAEIGCNHMGDFGFAFDLIDIAARCGVDIVKFQKREPRLLLSEEEYNTPHPVPSNSFGDTYGAHREYLEFTIEQHEKLKGYAEFHNVEYSCSVWDIQSTSDVLYLKPKHIKIPSASNLDWRIYDLLEGYEGTLHISLGMTTDEEIKKIVSKVKEIGVEDVVLYACTSGYPVQPEEVYLLDIPLHLVNSFKINAKIGYSGHHLGTDIDLVAIGCGATYLERHFTFNKTLKGTDHRASLDAKEMMELVKKVRTVEPTIQAKVDMPLCEVQQRSKLKRVFK